MSEIDIIYSILFFVVGANFGSFANVIILRLPKGQSIISPRSYCFSCKKTLQWKDNIPLISCLLYRAKCRYCKADYGYRHLLVEFLTAVLFVSCFLKFGFTFFLIEMLIFSFGLVVITFIDFDHKIIPDVFSLGGIVVGLAGALINPEREFLDALFGFLMGGGILWAVAYVYMLMRKEEGMGGGDIKLLGWIGAVLGVNSIAFVILAACFLGSFVGIFLMIKTRDGLKTSLAFGPYLALAALLYAFLGLEISQWYMSFFFPALGAS